MNKPISEQMSSIAIVLQAAAEESKPTPSGKAKKPRVSTKIKRAEAPVEVPKPEPVAILPTNRVRFMVPAKAVLRKLDGNTYAMTLSRAVTLTIVDNAGMLAKHRSDKSLTIAGLYSYSRSSTRYLAPDRIQLTTDDTEVPAKELRFQGAKDPKMLFKHLRGAQYAQRFADGVLMMATFGDVAEQKLAA